VVGYGVDRKKFRIPKTAVNVCKDCGMLSKGPLLHTSHPHTAVHTVQTI
jgi:hypothetical protein